MPRRPGSLTQKLVLPLIALVVLLAVVGGFLRTRAVERGYHETMILGADQLSRSLASATWHAMLADDRPAAYDTMQTVARQQGISRVRIFNKEGRVMFSTAPEQGRMVDKNAEACVLCHASAEPLVRVETPSRARVFTDADGHRRLGMITPIYNEPSCSTAACHAHPERQRVLGVLDVTLDLAPVDRRVGDARARILLATAIETLLVAAFVAAFVGFFVTRPIRRLVEANAALGRMDLEHPVEIRSSRELFELTRSFNAMRDRLGEAMAEIRRASEELEAKVQERTEQLRKAHQRLLQADRLASLGQLAASVAHEINNPLSGVLNYSVLMRRILKEDGIPEARVAEFRAYLERVSEQTARAGRIVSDLLSFSRRSKPHRAPADLGAIVRGTVSLVSHKLRLSGVEAELRLDKDLPPLACDASQVQQVVLNLVLNAAEATHGQGQVVVATRRAGDGQSLLLEVADEGEGIPPEALPRIFDPFFTTKEEGKGLGLGLAVVYGIVEAHGGTIDVRSRVGQGTTFTVKLPLAVDEGRPPAGELFHAPPGA
ncbi:MAG TPA: ATP-binding protein [Vicinamibacteria bacterium]|nr:ATP-binding protein [Vicinamibacteria bacterium]